MNSGRQFFSSPITLSPTSSEPSVSFTPSNVHLDVRLALGYLSALIAIGASFWAYYYKKEFKETKPVMVASVAAYVVLQGISWAWERWIEGSTVWEGKRKVFNEGRVSAEGLC